MGMFRNRKTEIMCPECGNNCRVSGSYLVKHNGQIMSRQYRQCVVCRKKFITFKDDDNTIWYNDKIVERG